MKLFFSRYSVQQSRQKPLFFCLLFYLLVLIAQPQLLNAEPTAPKNQQAGAVQQQADITLMIAGRPVAIELALTHRARLRGLMERSELAEDSGMLFVFPRAKLQKFWMKNTLIDLDILFLDDTGTVLSIHQGKAGKERPTIRSRQACRLVLELNSGWSQRHGLQVGDRIPLPEGLFEQARSW